MENTEIKEVEQRVKRYWYTDGIAELAGGGMFLLLGLYFGIQGYLGENSLVSVLLQASLALLMIAGAFGVRWLVNVLKARVTYPRTGYVQYHVNERDATRRRWIVGGIGMVVAIASILLVDALRSLDAMVLVTGLLVGAVFIILRGRASGLKRFYALGGLAIVLGVVLAFSRLPQAYSLGLFYGLLGVGVLVSGALVLHRYLSENPLPAEKNYE
jgi:hypothetical protein